MFVWCQSLYGICCCSIHSVVATEAVGGVTVDTEATFIAYGDEIWEPFIAMFNRSDTCQQVEWCDVHHWAS